jgi:hypothetical protein
MTLPTILGQLFPSADSGATPDPMMVAFSAGAVGLECLIAGLFFLRFWRRTGERLFLAFAIAFWLLGLSVILPTLLGRPAQAHGEVYLLRLLAFLIIILAILAKNVRSKRS